ncbi:MAG TPA: cytochrome c [Humisphaera sp.]
MSNPAHDNHDAHAAAGDDAASGNPAAGINLPVVGVVTLLSVLLVAVTVIASHAAYLWGEQRDREAKDAAAATNADLTALTSYADKSAAPTDYRWADDKKQAAVIPVAEATKLLVARGGKPGWATTQPTLVRAAPVATASLVPGLNPKKVKAGAGVFGRFGCATCHTTDGKPGVGPSLYNAFGSKVELANGATVTADEAYLRESIKEPTAKVHKGFQPVMPNFGPQIRDAEVDSVIEFIKSISPAPADRKYTGPAGTPPPAAP